jgi:hypothetical protein
LSFWKKIPFGESLVKKKKIDPTMIWAITKPIVKFDNLFTKKESIFGDQKPQIHSFLPFQKEKIHQGQNIDLNLPNFK